MDGQQIPIRSSLISRTGPTSVGRDAAAIAGTTALGAAIGAGADWGRGAAIGAGAGAAAGIIGVLVTRGHPSILYPEQVLTFRIEAPITVATDRAPQAFRYVQPGEYDRPAYTQQVPQQGGYYGAAAYPAAPAPYYYANPYPYYGYGYGYPYYWGPSFSLFVGPRYYGGFRGGYYGGGRFYGGGRGAAATSAAAEGMGAATAKHLQTTDTLGILLKSSGVLVHNSDRYAQFFCGLQRPIGLPQELSCQQHYVSFFSSNNCVGLGRIRNHSYRAG